MRGTSIIAKAFLAVSLTLLLTPDSGFAQGASAQRVAIAKLNHQAMAAYANLQFQEAIQLLRKAEGQCAQHNIRGTTLARLYLSMGIIEIGGNQNNNAALDYFQRAICLDSSVMLDPLNSTPEMEQLFTKAQNQVKTQNACSNIDLGPRPEYPTAQPTQPATQPTTQPPVQPYQPPVQPYQPPVQSTVTRGVEVIRHSPVLEQVRLVPIPIFAEVNPNIQVGQVIVYYRTLGERIFQQLVMRQHGQGYAAIITCDVLQTFDPTAIEYYIAVVDPNGQLHGTAGAEAQPHRVSIVNVLTGAPPALPNEAPPARCQEDCPPWNPDCNKQCKQMGELCDSSSECCSGMVCVHEACSPSDSEEGGGGAKKEAYVNLALTMGTGMGYITETRYADADVEDKTAPGDLVIPPGFAWSKLHFRGNLMVYISADLLVGATFRGDMSLDSKTSPVKPLVLANLAYRLVGGKVGSGFELYGLFGLGGGIIQHRVEFKDCPPQYLDQENTKIGCHKLSLDESKPDEPIWDPTRSSVDKAIFRESGKFAAELGLDMYFWFGKYVGLNFGIIFNLLAPDFAFNGDVQGGLAFRF